MRVGGALSVLLALCACAGAPPPRTEQAVSQQAASSDAQQRAKVHTELGGLYLSQGNLGVALEEARKALAASSEYAPAHSLMGLIHMQMGENGPAEASYERSLKLAPTDPEINNSYGWFLCQTGRERRALDLFQLALKSPLYATPSLAHANAGICSLRLKDDKGAEEHFLRALRFDPANDRAAYFLADISYRQGKFAAARQYLGELHKRAEPSVETLWLSLRVERRLGERDQEARLSAQLRRRFPDAPETQRLMQGRYE